jgi:hypothetical protein
VTIERFARRIQEAPGCGVDIDHYTIEVHSKRGLFMKSLYDELVVDYVQQRSLDLGSS